MCELLLRVVDKINPNDAILDQQCSKAGDVIVLKDNGWPWSVIEQTNPDWRIVKFPEIDVSVFEDMLRPDVDGNGSLIRRKAKKLDIDSPWFSALINASQIIEVRVPTDRALNEILDLKITKGPLA